MQSFNVDSKRSAAKSNPNSTYTSAHNSPAFLSEMQHNYLDSVWDVRKPLRVNTGNLGQSIIKEQLEEESPNFMTRRQELNVNYMIESLEFNSEEKKK